MTILQEMEANLYIYHTGGRLSSDSRLVLINEFVDVLQFTKHSKKLSHLMKIVDIGHTVIIKIWNN